MTVDTPLALFTTLFGWQFYSIIWDALVGSGIAFLPFLGVLIEVFVETRTEGDLTESRPRVAVARLETNVLLMLLVIAIGAQPASQTALTASTLSHQPIATALNPSPSTATPTSPDSTYGASSGGFDCFPGSGCGGVSEVGVPLWWYAVMAVSQGINRAVIAEFPSVDSIREMQQLSKLASITDPAVHTEASDFFTQCFIPAHSAFAENPPAGFDPDDIWMGSSYFQSNFYDDLRARSPVQDYPFDPSRDTEWDPAFAPAWGKPTCNEWWSGSASASGDGLRTKLLDQAELTTSSLLIPTLVNFFSFATPAPVEDWAIKKVLSNSPPRFSDESLFDRRQGNLLELPGITIRNDLSAASANVGVPLANMLFSIVTDILVLGAPMVQPLILMGIFALLPFAMVASRYSISFLVIGAIAIFTVSFWTVLWHIVSWLDDQLIKAMWPDQNYLLDAVFSAFSGDVNGWTKMLLLNMAVASLYFFLPALFSVLMAWAGVRASSGIGTLMGVVTGAGMGRAAQTASQMPGKAAGMATKGAKVATRST